MESHSDAHITAKRLTKSFGEFKAVDGVELDIASGTVFGLLGANGAGKSTLIRMLCGLLVPTSGAATVAGYDVASAPEAVKRRIGYMSQLFSLYADLTVDENLRLFGGIYGLYGAKLRERMAWARSISEIEGLGNARADSLSGGYRRRLALACAVLHAPAVLFLDEPTSGVDPIARRAFWDLIDSIASGGTTVVVTTHYLEEAEYCGKLALMHAGKVVAVGSPAQIKAQTLGRPGSELRANSLEEVFITITAGADQ